jgi:hypothetical protein
LQILGRVARMAPPMSGPVVNWSRERRRVSAAPRQIELGT